MTPVRPATAAEVADVLRAAGPAVLVKGAGTKQHWGGSPAGVSTVVDLSGLTGMVSHEPGDLVASVRAGTPLADLQAALGAAGQRLAIDGGYPGATVGGMLAAAESGPLRLHHGDGPALSYPDGWSLYAWRGLPIPREVADQLPTVTAERIRDEPNAEMRRVMLEYFGFERYLQESHAERVHSDETGVLWRVDLPGDEPLVMVEVVNSTPEPDGTRRTYFLRVPPDTERAREGVAWTFGLTEQEYQPLAQT